MQAPPENSLTEQQRARFDNLDAQQQDDIREKILTRNELNNIQINNDLLNQVGGQYGPAILNLNEINQAITSARTEITNEYNIDINRMLEGNLPEIRRAPGGGLNGLLVSRAVDILRRPQVGGKLRKSSKKRSAARRRSSKYRKARKSTKKNQTRGGRKKYSLN